MPLTSNQHLGHVGVEVHPAHRGSGAGSALLAEVERIAADAGRTVLHAWIEQAGEPADDDPDVLRPPTGSGRLRGAEPGVRLALGHGYVLEQAERYSVLKLPVDSALVKSLHDDAARRAGPEYRLHSWVGDLPDEHVDRFAALRTRMSTDVPKAGLEVEEDPWDAARAGRSRRRYRCSQPAHRSARARRRW